VEDLRVLDREFAGCPPVFQHAPDRGEDLPARFAHRTGCAARVGIRRLSQGEARQGGPGRHGIHPGLDRPLQPFGGTAGGFEGAAQLFDQLAQGLLEHRLVELALVLEVVEDPGLLDPDRLGDVLEPGVRVPLRSEVELRRPQDRRAGPLAPRLPTRGRRSVSSPRVAGPGSSHRSHLVVAEAERNYSGD
jgi:hypothetical protein